MRKAMMICALAVFAAGAQTTYRPLAEECTGTGCGYCPRGFVAMEEMGKLYPEDFIGIAWHAYNTSDAMYPASGYPTIFKGAPQLSLDRTDMMDPYYADGVKDAFTLPEVWQKRRESIVAPADISVSARLLDDMQHIEAEAIVTWAEVPSNDEYRIEYILVGNDLYGQGSGWNQRNYYAGGAQGYPALMEDFTGPGSAYKRGLHFNDVGLLSSGIGGVRGSVTEVKAGAVIKHKYTFNLLDAQNASGQVIDCKVWNMRVVAVLLRYDTPTGHAVNCNRCDVAMPAGVDDVMTDEIVKTEWYDLNGRKITEPDKGIYLKTVTDSKGHRHTTKVVR